MDVEWWRSIAPRARTIVFAVLFGATLASYATILVHGRSAKASVTDWYVFGARLGADAATATNAALYPQYGFADIGRYARHRARIDWNVARSDGGGLLASDLYVVADEPRIYAAHGFARIYVAGRFVGEIGSRSPDAAVGPYAPNRARAELDVPPVRAFGYRFPLGESGAACLRACMVSVRSEFTAWRIYRLGLLLTAPQSHSGRS